MRSMNRPLRIMPTMRSTCTAPEEESTSDTRALVELCSRVLQGWQKNTSKHVGSSCSRITASTMVARRVITRRDRRWMISRVLLPTAFTVPIGMESVAFLSRTASRRLRTRGKCEQISPIMAALGVSSSPFCAVGGDGGDDASCDVQFGDEGDNVAVEAQTLESTCACSMTFARMEVAPFAQQVLPEKMHSMIKFTAAGDVSCLRRSSP
mmetsp:Transcript_110523/g.312639  ORF Transcript_110523/g.312639 Transcript_110523/m.312639 type:complete len:209 (+) Transcript_110523:1053-1679(+)